MIERTWQCIGHNPTEWGFGFYIRDSGQLVDTKAFVTRQPSGRWHWLAICGKRNCQGFEPSANDARAVAEKTFREHNPQSVAMTKEEWLRLPDYTITSPPLDIPVGTVWRGFKNNIFEVLSEEEVIMKYVWFLSEEEILAFA